MNIASLSLDHTQSSACFLAATIDQTAGELVGYSVMMAAGAFWDLRQQDPQQEQGTRLTHLSLSCVSGSLGLLLARQQQGAMPFGDGAASRLAACCFTVLSCFVAAQQSQHEDQLVPATLAGWQQAATQLSAVAGVCKALRQAAESERWIELLQQQGSQADILAADALDAIMHLQAAAAASSSARQCSSGEEQAAASYCHRLCWKAAVSVLELQLSVSHQQQDRWEEQQAQVLGAVFHSLEADIGGTGSLVDVSRLLVLLGCCRLLLPAILQRPRTVQLAVAQRQGATQAASNGMQPGSQQPAVMLVSWLIDVAWGAFNRTAQGSQHRKAGVTAALVSTCFHPVLFAPSSTYDR